MYENRTGTANSQRLNESVDYGISPNNWQVAMQKETSVHD